MFFIINNIARNFYKFCENEKIMSHMIFFSTWDLENGEKNILRKVLNIWIKKFFFLNPSFTLKYCSIDQLPV